MDPDYRETEHTTEPVEQEEAGVEAVLDAPVSPALAAFNALTYAQFTEALRQVTESVLGRQLDALERNTFATEVNTAEQRHVATVLADLQRELDQQTRR